jgi:hypothetical protein
MSCSVESVHRGSPSIHALQNLTRVFTSRRKWIIGSIVICELLAATLTLMMKPTYGSTAMIELNKSGPGSLDLGLGGDDACPRSWARAGRAFKQIYRRRLRSSRVTRWPSR